nr:hypothetical protein [Nodosilinea sp. LEGE 07298]
MSLALAPAKLQAAELTVPELSSVPPIVQRDGFEAGQTWSQRLFFNKNGERASFTGQRLSNFQTQPGDPDRPRPSGEAIEENTEGLNMVLLIQVPLKQRAPMRQSNLDSMIMGQAAAPAMESGRAPSDVEAAVIGHGAVEGPFTEIDGLDIERDPDYPIRVAVQFYKATSNGVVSEADMADIRQQIDRVYADADYVGSLVVDGPSDGQGPARGQRPTEHDGPKHEPVTGGSASGGSSAAAMTVKQGSRKIAIAIISR